MRLLVDLSTFTSDHNGGKDEVAYNLLKGFSQLQLTQSIVCVSRDELVEKIKAIDKSYYVVPISRMTCRTRFGPLISAIPDVVYAKKLNKVIKDEHIDAVLYTNKFIPPVKLNVPTIVIPHDIQPLTIYKSDWSIYSMCAAIMTKNTLSVCDHIIAISDFDKNDMISKASKYIAKYHTIYDPICFKDFCCKDQSKKYITSINIQWPHKNIDTIIRAYAQVARYTELNLMLVGKLPKNIDEFKAIVRENNLEDRVIFTGFVTDVQLSSIIQKTRIYINASHFEGFGMTSVEMMGRGIPTIVAKNTAQPEVTRGLCYYYEPTDDCNALAKVILQELRHPMSQKSLQAIADEMRRQYSYEKISMEYWNFILQCTEKNKQ